MCCVLSMQSYLTLLDPMNCSPPGSSVHEIFQAKILEWVAISLRIFPTQGSNLGLLHCRQILYQLSYKGSPIITKRSVPTTLRYNLLGDPPGKASPFL